MRENSCELARNGSIHVLYNIEIRRKQNVKISLMYLHNISQVKYIFYQHSDTYKRGSNGHCPPLIPCLYYWCIHSFNGIRQIMKITCQQPMSWKILGQDVKKLYQSCW